MAMYETKIAETPNLTLISGKRCIKTKIAQTLT
jgi:hypothetical protein